MRYLGYLLILAVFAAGFFSVHILAALAGALAATFIYAADRRRALKAEPQALNQNMILDGAYQFFGKVLIMFVVYILGWFFANIGTTSGMLGRTIQAFVAISIIGAILGCLVIWIEKTHPPKGVVVSIWTFVTTVLALGTVYLTGRMFGIDLYIYLTHFFFNILH